MVLLVEISARVGYAFVHGFEPHFCIPEAFDLLSCRVGRFHTGPRQARRMPLSWWAQTSHAQMRGTTADIWAEESHAFMPTSRPFNGFVEYTKRLSPTCLVTPDAKLMDRLNGNREIALRLRSYCGRAVFV
jgi:hypothetical protein